jgi:hypothetical protein
MYGLFFRLSLFKIPENTVSPYPAKEKGSLRVLLQFDVTNCDFKIPHSPVQFFLSNNHSGAAGSFPGTGACPS